MQVPGAVVSVGVTGSVEVTGSVDILLLHSNDDMRGLRDVTISTKG